MSTTDFILQEATFNNHTTEELLNTAEREGNHLALYLYDAGRDDVEKEQDWSDDPMSYIEDTVMALVAGCEWIPDQHGWYLDGFHRDTNVFHHHIGIEKTHRGKIYKVFMEYGASGERVDSKDIDGLKTAKDYAIDTAIRKACNRDLCL